MILYALIIKAEGSGIKSGGNNENFENRNRPRISQISLSGGEFSKYGVVIFEF